MSSNNAPYATMHDLPKYEKRSDAVAAPWMKDQPQIHCGRGHDPELYVACNSQTAPFATFHNLPRRMEYVGPLPDAPWEKEQAPTLTCRGSQPAPEYSKNVPFGTLDNFQRLPQNSAIVDDAPWEKKLPLLVPSRGGTYEHSKLPSSQTAPFGTSENIEEQKQPNKAKIHQAPWDRDEVHYNKVPQRFPHGEDGSHYTSAHAPFATDSR